MRAGGHGRAQIEARIGRLLRRILRGDRILRSVSRRRRQREQLQPDAIDADLDLVRLGQPLDAARCDRASGGARTGIPHRPGSVCRTFVPARVPNGWPSKWSSCVRSGGSTTVSAPAERAGIPTARRLIFCAADKYRSRSIGDSPPTLMLSNPWLESSLGSIADTSISTSSRSRTAFWYSVRFRRRNVSVRPGSGLAAAARSREDSRLRDQRVVGRLGRARTPRWRHRARAKLVDDESPRFRREERRSRDRSRSVPGCPVWSSRYGSRHSSDSGSPVPLTLQRRPPCPPSRRRRYGESAVGDLHAERRLPKAPLTRLRQRELTSLVTCNFTCT